MKITIKANEKITNAIIEKVKATGDICSVELDFDCSYLWSDLEIWLEDDNGKYCDHMALNVSKRNKLQAHK